MHVYKLKIEKGKFWGGMGRNGVTIGSFELICEVKLSTYFHPRV